MVFTVSLKHLSFKQNIHNITGMLDDQKSTYAILRYAKDIPDLYYMEAMDDLCDHYDLVEYPKLRSLLYEYMANPMEVELD